MSSTGAPLTSTNATSTPRLGLFGSMMTFCPASAAARSLDLEGHVRHGLDQLGVGRVVPVALPLDAVRIVLVIADRVIFRCGSGISPLNDPVVGIPM